VIQPESEKEQLPEVIEDSAELKKMLAEERAKTEANFAGWQRAQADFVNYKRVAEQEKADIAKYGNASLLANLLPVLDDIERALAAVPREQAGQKWVEGFKLIARKFRDILEKLGVTCIESLGKEFDCRLMEAVTCQPGKKDLVILELEKGYKLGDRVIRPSKVVVGTGEEAPQKNNE
jgi:molecular chaperone GrpE